MVLYFRPLKVFLPLSAMVIGLGTLMSLLSFTLTGSMQESDIVVLTAGFMTGMLGGRENYMRAFPPVNGSFRVGRDLFEGI